MSAFRSIIRLKRFASDPENLPKWAAGVGGSIKNVNGEWIADSPMEMVKIKFGGQECPIEILERMRN
jgi:hypothetical protein